MKAGGDPFCPGHLGDFGNGGAGWWASIKVSIVEHHFALSGYRHEGLRN